MQPTCDSCTAILVGKNATYDGSTMMARTEDAPAGHFFEKKHVVIKPADQPRHYKAINSKFEIDLPDNPLQYTSMPMVKSDKIGTYGEAGVNIKNVALSATETISSNALVLGADPLVDNGLGEEDILTIVLPYINTAKEGVERLGALLEKYGTYEMNGIGFQDENEVWWLETIGGHHFIAKRVPDDAYVVGPNQQGIQYFDFVDAFGEKKNHICSKDMIEFITKNNLDLTFKKSEDLAKETKFDVRPALGSHTDFDRVYNTPRAWFMHRYLSPKKYKWDGPNADFTPESDDLPWSLQPDHKNDILENELKSLKKKMVKIPLYKLNGMRNTKISKLKLFNSSETNEEDGENNDQEKEPRYSDISDINNYSKENQKKGKKKVGGIKHKIKYINKKEQDED